ncbi:MAG: hypothetical protein WC913_03725 [Desulfuromonas sp.]
MKRTWMALGLVMLLVFSAGCSRSFVGGAALGAGGAGVAYEYQNKRALSNLEDDFKDGKIDKDEYLRRKKEIEHRSIVY